MTFVDHGDGTATLSGTPPAGTGGLYSITITAHNGVLSDSTQVFNLTVSAAVIQGTGIGYLAGVPGDGTPKPSFTTSIASCSGANRTPAGDAFWVAYAQQHNTAAGQKADRASIHELAGVQGPLRDQFVSNLPGTFDPTRAACSIWTEKMGQPGTPGKHSGSADEKYVLAAILGSDEYYSNAGGTPQDWVNADLPGYSGTSAGQQRGRLLGE